MVFSSVLKYEFEPLESTDTKFTSPHTAVSLVMDGSGYFDEDCIECTLIPKMTTYSATVKELIVIVH